MSDDPFARFERSRGGLLIPVALFVLGAVPTGLAIGALDRLETIEEAPAAGNDAVEVRDGGPIAELDNEDAEP